MLYSPERENVRVDNSLGEERPTLPANIETVADLADLRHRWGLLPGVPVIAADRNTGSDISWAGIDARALLRGEQSGGRFAALSVILSPGATLPSHWYDDTHAWVLVRAGGPLLQVGDSESAVGPNSLGYVPPRTHLALKNSTGEDIEVMVVYSPAGVERGFTDAHDAWLRTRSTDVADYRDQLARYGIRFEMAGEVEALPNDAATNHTLAPVDVDFNGEGDMEALRSAFMARPAVPRLVETLPEEWDQAHATGQIRRKQLLTGDDTAGLAMLNLLSYRPGPGAPAHHQPIEDEFFFITGGDLELTCATQTLTLSAGAMAYCPRNCTHAFNNWASTDTQFVTFNSPAGHERSLEALRRHSANGATRGDLYNLSAAGGFIWHSDDHLG